MNICKLQADYTMKHIRKNPLQGIYPLESHCVEILVFIEGGVEVGMIVGRRLGTYNKIRDDWSRLPHLR